MLNSLKHFKYPSLQSFFKMEDIFSGHSNFLTQQLPMIAVDELDRQSCYSICYFRNPSFNNTSKNKRAGNILYVIETFKLTDNAQTKEFRRFGVRNLVFSKRRSGWPGFADNTMRYKSQSW